MKLFFLWLCSLFFVRVFTFCSYILLLVIATCSLRITCGGSLQNAMQIDILSSVLNSVRYSMGTLYVIAPRGPGMKDQEQSMHVWKKITSVPFAVYDRTLMVCPMNYAHIFIEFKFHPGIMSAWCNGNLTSIKTFIKLEITYYRLLIIIHKAEISYKVAWPN